MISPFRKFQLIIFGIFIISLLCSAHISAQTSAEIEMMAFNFRGNGARALAMGGAYIAVGGDASAIFWNPAGLASITESQVTAAYNFSGKIDRTYSNFSSGLQSTTAFDYPLDFSGIDYFALTLPLKQEDLFMVHQVSFRTVHNFGFSGSTGSPYTISNGVIDFTSENSIDGSGTLQEISYGVAFRIYQIIQIGAAYHHYLGGYDYTFSDSSTGTTYPFNENIDMTANWDFLGDNFSVGIIIKPLDYLSIGGVFKTNYELKGKYNIEQNYSYNDTVSNISTELSSKGEAVIKHPSEWGFGISFSPLENLTIAADYTYSDWLADQNEDGQYIRGTINEFFPPYDPDDPPYQADPLNYPTFTIPDDYQQEAETYLRFGGEYIIDSKDFSIAVRGGFWQHNSIFTDSNAESITWTGITAGAGLTWNFLKFDVALVMESASYPTFVYSADSPDLDFSNTLLFAQLSIIFESF